PLLPIADAPTPPGSRLGLASYQAIGRWRASAAPRSSHTGGWLCPSQRCRTTKLPPRCADDPVLARCRVCVTTKEVFHPVLHMHRETEPIPGKPGSTSFNWNGLEVAIREPPGVFPPAALSSGH